MGSHVWGLDAPSPQPVSSAATQAPVAVPAGSEDAADSDTGEAATPDSTEQGQTQLPESFDHRPIAALLHESRLVGLRDTTFERATTLLRSRS